MFGGMSGAYAPYQMPGLTTGFPMGFPLGSPFGLSLGPSMAMPLLGALAQPRFTADEWLVLQGMAATQPAVPSISPDAPAIQPSSLCVPQASSYHASAPTNSAVSMGRPDVKIDLGSIGPPRKPFDYRRLATQPSHQRNSNRNRGETTVGVAVLMAALTAVVVVAVMALDGAVDVAVADNEETTVDVVATREVDLIVTDNREAAPGTVEEGGPRNCGGGWPPELWRRVAPGTVEEGGPRNCGGGWPPELWRRVAPGTVEEGGPRNCGGGWPPELWRRVAPGTVEEGGPRNATRIRISQATRMKPLSVPPGSEGEPKSTKMTLATDSKDPTTSLDQPEHHTGNVEASRTWIWTSEHLNDVGENAPSFLV